MRNRPSWFLLTLVFLSLTLACATSSATVYFVVGEHGNVIYGDSYILPLEDPHDIAHARDLILKGPAGAGRPIVVARIERGADGINRDFLAPNQPLWSWHVTDLLDFADGTIEILDGTPWLVEEDVDGWLRNTSGSIGFWRYTVIAEIDPVPEPSTFVLVAACLVGLALTRFVSRPRWHALTCHA